MIKQQLPRPKGLIGKQSFPRPKRLRFGYAREVLDELRKVVWPNRRDATRLTILVLIISAVVGLLLGAVDLGFSTMVKTILIGVR